VVALAVMTCLGNAAGRAEQRSPAFLKNGQRLELYITKVPETLKRCVVKCRFLTS
jgi:hypothetical protein